MFRAKPYDKPNNDRREESRADEKWQHDKFGSDLASRLDRSRNSGGLADRLGQGQGRRELFPDGVGGTKQGVELLPGGNKSARYSRKSTPRGSTSRGSTQGARDEHGRALVADRLKALARNSKESNAISIMGSARGTIVLIEQLVQGTTAEDVESSFSTFPISSSKLVTSSSSRTASVEVEIANRRSAEELVKQYNGVLADGERLRLSIVERREEAPRASMGDRMGMNWGTRGTEVKKELVYTPPPSGKMYSDKMTSSTSTFTLASGTSSQSSIQSTTSILPTPPSLSDRMGRR